MKNIKKIGFFTKLLSHRNYLNEVSVEGKATPSFFFRVKHYDKYASQIMRTGNCITLLSNKFAITVDTFFNPVHFEDFSQFVFWTFNKSFLLKLEDKMQFIPAKDLLRCLELLKENFAPYIINEDETDEELLFCIRKLDYLKADPKFARMFSLDEENRKKILQGLENRVKTFNPQSNNLEPLSFMEVLTPVNGSTQETLELIKAAIEKADLDFNLFSVIEKLPNGKNPYKLNGCIAAMIDFFYQNNYFKKEYTLEQIFSAYFHFSGNSIGKFKVYLSEFRDDNHYLKYFNNLKALKINKL